LGVLRCACHGSSLRELLRSPYLPRLRRFVAAENNIGPAAFKDLVAVKWQRLEVLDVSSNSLTAAAARAPAGPAHLGTPRRLDLSGNFRVGGDAAVRALAQSPYLGRRLRRLDVGFCGLTCKGLEALAGAPWLGNLTWLVLTGTDIGPAEAKVL